VLTSLPQPPATAGAGIDPLLLFRALAAIDLALCLSEAPAGPVVWASDACARVIGSPADGIVGSPCWLMAAVLREDALRAAIEREEPVHVLLQRERSDGSRWWDDARLTPVHNERGRLTHWLAQHRDVTEDVESRTEAEQLANSDALTGLPNRRQLREHLHYAVARANRTGSAVPLLFVDLNDFKSVNDRFGHPAGDELLVALGGRLHAAVRSTDLVAREGGDEFLVLLPETAPESVDAALTAVAKQLCDAVEAPFVVGGQELRLSISVGGAVYPRDARTADDLIRAADERMYSRKRGLVVSR